MGCKHNGILMIYYPNQKGTGVDYGNIEFKTSIHSQYDLYPKDEAAEYFLFHDIKNETFSLCDKQDIPVIKFHRKFSQLQVDRICIWKTKDEIQSYEKVEIIKNEFDSRK